MKTVAIFSGYYLPHLGGVEKYTNNMALELKKRGYNIIIVTNNDNNYKNYEVIDSLKIYRLPIYKIFKNRFPILKVFSKEYRNLKKCILAEDIDIIFANTRFYFTSVLANNIAHKKNIKSFHIEHGSAHLTLENPFLDFFIRIYEHIITFIVKRKSSGFIGASKAGDRWLEHFKIKSIDTWNNAIVKNEKYSKIEKPKNKVVFAYAGRLIKQKGILNILNAFEKLEKKYSNIELHIAGDGALYQELKKANKSKRVHFYGHIDSSKVYEILSKSHILLMPSIHPEGLSYTLLEAGLFQNAAIATNIGAFKDVIINNYNGLLIDTNIDSLYKAMEKLIKNPELRFKLSKQLYNDVLNNYTWEANGQKISDFIERSVK